MKHLTLGYFVININPIAFQIGPMAIHWYGIAYVLAISIGLWAILRYADALGIERDIIWRLFIGTAIAALLGGRLYFDLQQPDFFNNYLLKPINLIAVWNGGMAYFGALFAAAPTAAILAKRAGLVPWIALDIAALFGAVGQMFGRLGNLINGDIVGYAAGHPQIPVGACTTAPCIAYVQDPRILPWSTVYLNPQSFITGSGYLGIPYQPAAAYEILINLAALAILWPLRLLLPRHIRSGAFFSLYVACYAIGQFLIFFARSNVFVPFLGVDTLKQAQWTALMTLLGIGIIYYWGIRRWATPWLYDRFHPCVQMLQKPQPQAPESTSNQIKQVGEVSTVDYSISNEIAKNRHTELQISHILRGGVMLSAGLILLGLLLFVMTGSHVTAYPHSLSDLVQSIVHGQPLGIVVLGLVCLILTPMMRVVISLIAFVQEQDRPYVIITSIVLGLLVVSIVVLGALLGAQQVHHTISPNGKQFIIILLASTLAGVVGALVGLGGGVFVVPLLTIAFGLPIELAIGASIVSVIATSSGAAAAYVKDHLTNLRVGMFLEIATTIGAIVGALLAVFLASRILFLLFGAVLFISAIPLLRKIGEEFPKGVIDDVWSRRLALASSYPERQTTQPVTYAVTNVPAGFGLMLLAGLISGLLGIGSGTFKVLAMDVAMRLPMKVSSTTSNFMIGVTAAASAGIYFQRNAIDPLIAAPVALGVLGGALIGAKLLPKLANRTIRFIFLPLLVIIASEMLWRGWR